MTTCQDCGRETGRQHASFCDPCRVKHRGKPSIYRLTPEREAYLRTHYIPSERGISIRIAAVLRVPKWKVCRWAAELGLARKYDEERNWRPEEVAFLEEHIGSRTPAWIAKRLKRSLTAVTVKAKRLRISRRDGRDWYTAHQVAEAFGVDPTTVIRWIGKGWLQATTHGQDHPDRHCMYQVTYKAMARFVREHRGAYDLAKVDQLFFLDLVFGATPAREDAAA
jgi:hypothetical protein